jgi:two-component system, sensor histidine kinase and response regulator
MRGVVCASTASGATRDVIRSPGVYQQPPSRQCAVGTGVGVTGALTQAVRDAAPSSTASAEQVAAVLAAATEDLIVATDPAGVVTVFNAGAERMLGYRGVEVLGRQTPLLWHDATEVANRAAELGVRPGFEVFAYPVQTGSPDTRAWTFVRKDGSRLVAQLTVTPVLDARGVLSGYLGIARDVTDRQRIEEALRRAEERYRTLVERMPAITYIAALDDAGSTLYVSPQIEPLLGFPRADWTTDPELWLKLLHAEDRARVLAEFAHCRAAGLPFAAEYRLLARDGRVVWVRDEAALVQAEGEQPGFVQGVMLDITDRKCAEEARRRAEAKYRDIVENAVEGIYQSTPDGRVVTANRAVAHLLGYASPEEFVTTVTDAAMQIYVDPRDRARLASQLVEHGTAEAFECQVRRKDGGVIWILQNVRAVFDDSGRPLYFEGTIENVTARKQAEAEHARLEQERDQFFSSISHDLRTPLAAITASIGVVLSHEPTGTPPALHRLLVNIDQAADDMANLVEDLLELTRLQAGRVELARESTDLREVARRAARQIEALAHERGQQVQLELPRQELAGWVDTQRLGRVLLNLLSNATKYGREQGIIRLCLEERPRQALFSIVDDGYGVPEQDRERIFERFYRAETEATRRSKGSGLGLPIARALVELHGGRIWVESSPGRGAVFRVALPLDASDQEKEHTAQKPSGELRRRAPAGRSDETSPPGRRQPLAAARRPRTRARAPSR